MRFEFKRTSSVLALNLTVAAFSLMAATVEAAPTIGRSGLVVSADHWASEAGKQVLASGGNAADAAVATALVLAVTRPYFGSIGGGGFLLVRMNGKVHALDYRERAPSAARPDMYTSHPNKKASEIGGLAVATPGVVRGLWDLHQKFGKLPWTRLAEPAIRLAESGYVVSGEIHDRLKESLADFDQSGKTFWSREGKPLEVGTTVRQPKLAAALRAIQKQGPGGFYKGPVARDIVETVKKEGGILTLADLSEYRTLWRDPLELNVYGHRVYSMPPPSSGGTLLLSELQMAEKLKLHDEKPWSGAQFHLLAEIMRRAFFERQYIADPRAMTVTPAQIFDPARIARWVSTVTRDRRTEPDWKSFDLDALRAQPAKEERLETTHYCVVDRDGNAVSATTTLNGNYGSGVWTSRFGINLNNEMDDFTARPGEPNMFGLTQSALNKVEPGKTPLSSMTPTIVEKDGALVMLVGSPGGPRIINSVFQVLFWALTTKFDIDEIVQAPRVHHQFLPDIVFHDRTLNPEVVRLLEEKGHKTKAETVARVYAIRKRADGLWEGAFDARGEGGGSGY
ncbi:MAG: Glutathione hydrolase proenzyme [Thermoanaerobaculia bacterium]|nr:Glutathione hydrolase proenzyme [Thermoanaerobaculia bacterium]